MVSLAALRGQRANTIGGIIDVGRHQAGTGKLHFEEQGGLILFIIAGVTWETAQEEAKTSHTGNVYELLNIRLCKIGVSPFCLLTIIALPMLD